MKPVKFKFSSDSAADCVARHYLLELYLLRIFFLGFSWYQRNL